MVVILKQPTQHQQAATNKDNHILTTTDKLDKILNKVSRQMINMEQDKQLYNIDNSKSNTNNKFNIYEHNNITYDLSFYYGILIFYFDTSISNKYSSCEEILTKLNNKLDKLTTNKMINSYYPFSTKTTHYTALYSNTKKTKYRRLKLEKDIEALNTADFRYTWYIIFKTPYLKSNYYISIYELNDTPISDIYLFNSLNTIIYDGCNIYNVKDGHKQIDYPYMEQYNITTQGRLLNEYIHYDKGSDISKELYYIFTGKILHHIKITNDSYPTKEIGDLKYLTSEITDKWSKEWRFMKHMSFKETIDDKTYKCFISGMPLYDYAIAMGFYNNNTINYILISPILFYSNKSRRNYEYSSFKHMFETHTKLTIIKIYKININRKIEDLLDMKEVTNLSKNKQDILSFLLKKKCNYKRYGIYNLYIFTSKDYKYIGLNIIDDNIIFLYNKKKNVKLFKICNKSNECEHLKNNIY